MFVDVFDWDDENDPEGNVHHIAAHGVTQADVEEILRDHVGGPDGVSNESGLPMVFGWTSSGKHIVVIYEDESDPGLIVIRPTTAYPVPEYGG
jgi:hypothetical protein